ncbi:unnamed protein product [Diatraea saccharalis]|uniref:Uncharacterized protein n=1 Tax=Diatraea saccharalis TaxID=40085 RepID=A0A9N9WEY2_9NEOP|nr:unnamed protein product [Diatraea saccharalis]
MLNKKRVVVSQNILQKLEYEKKKWFHQLPQELGTINKNLTQDQIRKQGSSALHGETLAYETSKYHFGTQKQVASIEACLGAVH